MTFYALSSGPGLSGVAVIRVSGSETVNVIKHLTNSSLPKPKEATLKKVHRNCKKTEPQPRTNALERNERKGHWGVIKSWGLFKR